MTASKSILLRVTPQEHAEIASRASESGQSLSRFLVSRALGDAPSTWTTAPQGEVARAREALQAALRALDGVQVQEVQEVEQAPAQEADSAPAIEAVPAPAPVEPVVQAPQLADPEVVFVLPASAKVTDGGKCKWIKAVGEIDRDGVNGHAIKPPKGVAPFLSEGREALLRPGTLVVACLESSTYYPLLHLGWTESGKRHIQWLPWDADDSTLDWRGSKLSTLQELRQLLRRGPPGSPEPAPEPVPTVEVRPLSPAEQAVAAELDEALATTNPFDAA